LPHIGHRLLGDDPFKKEEAIKTYDEPAPEKFAASEALHECLRYLQVKARDFLDESDEILSPKYSTIRETVHGTQY